MMSVHQGAKERNDFGHRSRQLGASAFMLARLVVSDGGMEQRIEAVK
jgi:hypothetical protein